MRTATYIRVSTEEQALQGHSIESQRSLLERKAAESDMTIVKEYIDDGYSAKNTKRPAYQQMIKDVDLFDVVFFWRLDRITRKSSDFHKLTEQLSKSNVGIKSATEPIDTTTAIGRFQLELSVSLAQLERETISERVHFVMEEQARKGKRNGSPAPLGYDLIEGKLIVNEEQSEAVKYIYEQYLSGIGMKSIAHKLIREESPLFWSGATVKYILQNPVYTGKLRYNYIAKSGEQILSDGIHQPIIDDVTFQRVQNEIQRRLKGGRKFTSDFIFSSVLKCARCGEGMQGFSYKVKDRLYKTYRCGGRYDKGICDFPSTRENGVIEAFINALDISEAKLEKHFISNDSSDKEKKRLATIEKELESIGRRKKRFQIAYANDLISLEELRQHTEEDKEQEEKLKKELETTSTHTKSHWTKEELIQQLKQIRDYWHVIDNDKAKKAFIQEAFEYLVIDISPGEITGQGRRPKLVIADFRFRS